MTLWYETAMAGVLQRAAEIERTLTEISTRWLGGEDAKVRRMSWHQKLGFARPAASKLEADTCRRLEDWLDDCDRVRRSRNELAHSTLVRIMVGPGEDESDEDPDRVGLLRDESGSPVMHTLSRADFAALAEDFGRIAHAGVILSATGLRHLALPEN